MSELPVAWKPFTKPEAVRDDSRIVTLDELALIKNTIAKDATDAELKLFLFDCKRQGVHPLDRLIHFTVRTDAKGNRKYTPITSVDFMRMRAADTGEYAGSDDAIHSDHSDPSDTWTATVTVWRLVQGQRCSFTATARWSEYKPAEDFMWRKMPHTMLGKCAEALALRKGFPRQLAGLYAKEEMEQAQDGQRVIAHDPPTTVIDTTTGAEVPATTRPTPPEGYRYIDNCSRKNNGWYELHFGSHKYSTRDQQLGAAAMQAYQAGVPVRVTNPKPNPKYPNEFYINEGGLQTWKPAPTDAELDAEIAARELAKQAGEIA